MITGQWWTALFPGLCLAVSVLAFSLFGDNLRVFLDPTNRR
jgi:peptide/nickel transport system permease protein